MMPAAVCAPAWPAAIAGREAAGEPMGRLAACKRAHLAPAGGNYTMPCRRPADARDFAKLRQGFAK